MKVLRFQLKWSTSNGVLLQTDGRTDVRTDGWTTMDGVQKYPCFFFKKCGDKNAVFLSIALQIRILIGTKFFQFRTYHFSEGG